MKHDEVITVEQTEYRRHWGRKLIETRKKWCDLFGWYPIEQKKHYDQFGKIYKESLDKYGKKEYLKYAQARRLRSVYTKEVDSSKTTMLKRASCYPMAHMANIKVSATTNGMYGLIPPGHQHYC